MKYTKPEMNITYLNNEEALMVSGVIALRNGANEHFKEAGYGTNPKYSSINFE